MKSLNNNSNELLINVYVGTYAKYNNGSIAGEWLNLTDYNNYDEFINACKELHDDEEDPEFMFQDYEFSHEFLKNLIGESFISPDIFEVIKSLEGKDLDLIEAYINATGSRITDAIDNAEDNYLGEFKDDYDLGYHFYENGLIDIPENLINYFDFEKYGRDCGYDLANYNGYYFYY